VSSVPKNGSGGEFRGWESRFTRHPAKSEVEYIKPHADEESRLRAVILSDYPYHMPEFDIALHTGMGRANNMV
jgi:hypothetical protein